MGLLESGNISTHATIGYEPYDPKEEQLRDGLHIIKMGEMQDILRAHKCGNKIAGILL